MATGMVSRLAGKALGDFFKVGMGAVSSAAQQKTLGYLASKANYADAPGILGAIASHPGTVSNLVGAAAPIAVAGSLAGIGLAGQRLLGGGQGQAVDTQRQALYSQQPFVPGTLPFTNSQASELMLDQMKMQHQLQVIQARQSAGSGQGSLYSDPGLGNVYDIASKIYA